MTVSSSTSKNTYAGNGSTTVFAFSFPVLDEAHFTVEEINDTTGVVTSKTLTTHYTVSGTGNDTGRTNYSSGNITMLTAPASGVTLVIKRNMPFLQETDYVENDTFPAESHEEALDELTMTVQQLKEAVDQSIKFDSSVAFSGNMAQPSADKYLKFDSAGTAFEAVTLSATAGLGNVVEDVSPQLGGDLDTNGNDILVGAGDSIIFEGATADAFETTIAVVDPTADRTITFPDASLTVIGASSTDTLTNKTISLGSNTVSGTTAQFNTALSDGSFATLAGSETLTNKTIDADNNTITNIGSAEVKSSMITGQTAGTVAGGDLVLIADIDDSNNFKKVTAQSIADLGATGITLGTPVASTSGTSIDFTSIPAGTKRVTINFSGVSTSGTSNPLIQIGDSGGVETSGYLAGSSDYTGQVQYTTGYGIYSGVATNVLHGSITLTLLSSSAFTWACQGVLNNSAGSVVLSMGGAKSLSAELDRVRITTVGGSDTFDAGTINIAYE